MLLVIDNYDSFVFNIVRYCEELGRETRVVRNDRIDLAEIEALRPAAILISPGPCSPREAGVSLDLVRALSGRVPILGVCLGHQCIGSCFGGRVEPARVPMHGRASAISHDGDGLFAGLPDPLRVGRYHSLIVVEEPAMDEHLRVTARSPEGEVMALAHRRHPTLGVQFHPESVLSEHGHALLANFLGSADRWWRDGGLA
ncbi:anthranilate synthase component II [Aureimonas leprariae]|uniref:Aminodeoxychorismate/anthranilate synthase component II n=1 Tax=Plantimonas leprariae TaxID=2615207 RepID=A0A7V7PT77_9HYPH|nr:aminodeoxychorismate/anthranilate synthase component II [Aureimonas leprariae]KAB0682836.1 aminodeoxychorismate/anthranilate synthase component II [Aureimonas leprariae]